MYGDVKMSDVLPVDVREGLSALVSSNSCHCVVLHEAQTKESGDSATSAVSAWSNFTVAVVAVLGYLGHAFWRWWTRPKIRLREASKYNFRRNLLAEDRDSNERDCGGLEYLIPIINKGRQLAVDVTAFVDCVLKKSGDGDKLDTLYFGLPRRMSWADTSESIDIARNETAYLRLARLATSVQTENTIGADVEASLTCYLHAMGCSQDDLLLISQSKVITVFSRICARAKNSSVAHIRWVSLHWEGGTELKDVSDKNFKIRLATDDEAKLATAAYENLVKEGEGC